MTACPGLSPTVANETKEIFVAVADSRELPSGQMIRVHVHGEWVLVINVEGRFFAVADTCSHEDASLYKGALRGNCIQCPLHGSRFNIVTGEPLEEPAEEPIDVYPVQVLEHKICVGPAQSRN